MLKSTVAQAAGAFLVLSVATLASCASSTHSSGHGLGGDDSGLGDDDGSTMQITGSTAGDDSGPGFMGGTAPNGMCSTLKRACSSACTDFPTAPVMDTSAPANAASLFGGSAGSGAGPCISDPQAKTLFPQNWLRPRFAFSTTAGQVYQITLTSTRQANPLVAYTSKSPWTLPKTVWDALRGDSWGDEVDVKICGVATSGGSPACSTSSFTIAPASAGGSMIYWAAVGPNAGPPRGPGAQAWLEGFAPGDESVATTLTVSDVQTGLDRQENGTPQGTPSGASGCIGCHTAVPDGASVTFVDEYPWPDNTANVSPVGDAGTTGQVPSWLTTQGGLQMSMPWLGVMTFSKTDWQTEKVGITTYGCPAPTAGNMQSLPGSGQGCSQQNPFLMWTQLDAPAPTTTWDAGQNSYPQAYTQEVMNGFGTTWGFLAKTGDPNPGAEFANWSHDGTKVVYVSTNAGRDGRLGCNGGALSCNDKSAPPPADLYTIPFNDKQGGTAAPVNGAADANVGEYYPSYSEDDQFITYVGATMTGTNGLYYNPYGEIYVIPASGGTATRLAANDPVACPVSVIQNGNPTTMTPTSPGVYNSWPKWSPDVESCADGSTYYWIVFSSARLEVPFGPDNGTPDGPTSQLYMTAISVDKTGKITTYPALYVWNQPTTSLADTPVPNQPQSNHTPVWETIAIPRHPMPMVN